MFSSIAKMACVFGAVAGPFVAGLIVPHVVSPQGQVVLVLLGAVLGMAGVFGFASIERAEDIRLAAASDGEG